MDKYQERKYYRKSLNSSGQLFLGGEKLHIKSCDVSLRGIMVEVFPGKILSNIDNIQEQVENNQYAEIFVEDLKLTGEAKIIWVKEEDDKIFMGLEFKDVHYNAEKLWMKRLSYRQQKSFACKILHEDEQIDVNGINISISGLAVSGPLKNYDFQPGHVVKLLLTGVAVYQALGKIIWIKEDEGETMSMGLQYIELG